MPISNNGLTTNTKYEKISLFFIVAELIVLCLINGIKKKNFIILLFFLFYLIASSLMIIGEHFLFSLPRFLYITIPLILFSINIEFNLDCTFYSKVFDIIFVFILIGNVLSFFNFFNINSFLVDHYTQYLDYITNYQLMTKKPILIFGVHNLAAFFYMGFFMLTYFYFYYKGEYKYLVQSIFYLILIVFLRCSTSFMFLIFALFIFIYFNKRSYKVIFISMAILIVCIIFYNSDIFILYKNALSSNSNGFIPRYLEGFSTLYKSNYDVLTENVLGIGYTVGDITTGLYYADSGYILTLTTGGLFYFFSFYIMFARFLKINLKVSQVFIIVFLLIMLMEFGFITFFYYKTIAFILFIVFSANAICNVERSKNDV